MSFFYKNKIKKVEFAIFSFVFFATFFVAQSASAAPVYYSVGQSNSTELMTGSPNVTVSSGLATFTVAQTGNIGVGDRIIVGATTLYISGKVDTSHWNVVTNLGATPADISTSTAVTHIYRAFASLANAISGASDATHLNTTDLTSGGGYVLNIPCYYDTGADTTSVAVSGYTTSANNYIKIYTPNNTSTEVNVSQRHSGKWDDGKYNLTTTDNVSNLRISSQHIRIEGLQVYRHANIIYSSCIMNNINSGSEIDIKILNNILRGNGNLAETAGVNDNGVITGGTGKITIWNNIIYDHNSPTNWGQGIYLNNYSIYAYNNTITNCRIGVDGHWSANRILAKNNLISDCVASSYGTFAAGTDYNATDDASMGYTVTGGGNTHDKVSQTFSFVNSAADDFHLAPTDIAAKNSGADLSADANLAFNTDIDGQTRSTPWDIGADEAEPKKVYYSVGQSAADLKTGTPTVTIATGTATFSTAQTGNIGVGDRVTYNTNQIAYISTKTHSDMTRWSLVTATGGVPADVTDATVNSITREFTSLSAAVTSASNASHINNTDLTAANVILNLPCYYDSGADTNSVTVSGYTTGLANYVRIYTPYDTLLEVNQSQRHKGKSGTGYVLTSNDAGRTFLNYANHVRLEGLEINNTNSSPSFQTVAPGSGMDIRLGSSIFNARFAIGNVINGNNRIIIYNIVHTDTDNFIDLPANSNIVLSVYSSTLVGRSVIRENNTAYYYNNIINTLDAFLAVGTYVGLTVIGQNNSLQEATAAGTTSCTNCKVGQTFSFVNTSAGDYHLTRTDTGARNAGIDLQHDAPPAGGLAFDRDIDGQTRSGNWDIGADEIIETEVQSPQAGTGISSGLVGHWTFNGEDIDWNASSGQVKDESPNGNNGTVSGLTKTSVADGKLGQGINFNGTSSVVSVGNTNQAVNSISFWAKPTSTSQYAIDLDGGAHYVRISAGVVTAFGFASPTVYVDGTASAIFTDANWHHITVTTATGFSAGNLTIGKMSSNYFSGTLDDIRLYNRILSSTEVIAVYKSGQATVQKNIQGNTSGLVGYWSFDGPTISGTTVNDLSGNSNNGTISGATVADGKVGQGMGFDGGYKYVSIPDQANLRPGDGSFSIALWMKAKNINQAAVLLAKRDNNNPWSQYSIGICSNNSISCSAGKKIATSYIENYSTKIRSGYTSSDVVSDSWQHVVAVFDKVSNSVKVYVDGSEQAMTMDAVVGSWPVINNTEPLRMANNNGSLYFDGSLDEVRLYNRALSIQEINELYGTGKVQIRK